MKIGVLSDTHVKSIDELPHDMIDSLRRTDLIIHLGDYDSLDVVSQLDRLGDFVGITGNHDGPEICSLLPEQEIIEVKGKRLALVHGHGCVMPFGFKRGLLKRFRGERIDAVLYGHTHVTKNMYRSGVLFFNPGSAAGRFPSSVKSYGILTITESIRSEIFYISETVYSRRPRFILPGAAKPVLQKVPVYNQYTHSSQNRVIKKYIVEIFEIPVDRIASYRLSYMLQGKDVIDPVGDIQGLVRDVAVELRDFIELLIERGTGRDRTNTIILADEIADSSSRIILAGWTKRFHIIIKVATCIAC